MRFNTDSYWVSVNAVFSSVSSNKYYLCRSVIYVMFIAVHTIVLTFSREPVDPVVKGSIVIEVELLS